MKCIQKSYARKDNTYFWILTLTIIVGNDKYGVGKKKITQYIFDVLIKWACHVAKKDKHVIEGIKIDVLGLCPIMCNLPFTLIHEQALPEECSIEEFSVSNVFT